MKNDEPVCDSLQIAERFEKRHQEVLYAIEGRKCSCNGKGCQKCSGRGYQQLGILQEDLEINTKSHLSNMFKKSSYKDRGGRIRPIYYLTRDGFSILAMGFTGKEALKWKLEYIEAFNKMESILKEKSTLSWEETRRVGKFIRNSETDTIKKLVEYAKEQGSTHSDKLYMTYSKLANKMAGITSREEATITQLNNLSMMENIILNVIEAGLEANRNYKQIYKDCKERIQMVSRLAYLN